MSEEIYNVFCISSTGINILYISMLFDITFYEEGIMPVRIYFLGSAAITFIETAVYISNEFSEFSRLLKIIQYICVITGIYCLIRRRIKMRLFILITFIISVMEIMTYSIISSYSRYVEYSFLIINCIVFIGIFITLKKWRSTNNILMCIGVANMIVFETMKIIPNILPGNVVLLIKCLYVLSHSLGVISIIQVNDYHTYFVCHNDGMHFISTNTINNRWYRKLSTPIVSRK